MKGNPLKNTPPHLKKDIENYHHENLPESTNLICLINGFVNNYYGLTKNLFTQVLPIMDSLDNLNINFGPMHVGALEKTPKYFKSALKLYNQLSKEEQEATEFLTLIFQAERNDILSNFTPEQQVTYKALILILVKNNLDPNYIEKVKTMLHFIKKYPYEFSPFEYAEEERPDERLYYNHQMSELFENFFRRVELFNYEIDKKGSFLKQYYALKEMEKIHSIEIKDNLDKYVYEKQEKALNYKNNNFTVIIPKTSTDFINESNQQHNCVYRSYLPKVAKNYTYIVFIRRNEELEKSYITCEVDKKGKISQYLAKLNSAPEKEALAFKKEYQEWLDKNWNRE